METTSNMMMIRILPLRAHKIMKATNQLRCRTLSTTKPEATRCHRDHKIVSQTRRSSLQMVRIVSLKPCYRGHPLNFFKRDLSLKTVKLCN